ncbi:MAG: hypothetical protein K2K68_07825 [Duncaniella sp.]|nr:hypothetical protein [Duncaniella sp.]MDE6581440.1 hypothetical protein [Duncaniella sp.]
MKKSLFLGLALVSVALASCGDCKSGSCESKGNCGDKEELYAGILPATDAEGYVYSLRLDYDDDNNYTDGDYSLSVVALQSDTVSAPAFVAGPASYTEGDFKIETKSVNGAEAKVMTLLPEAKESLGTPDNSPLYFLVNDNQTLTMVGADFTKAENDSLNYTLTLK